MSLAHAVRFNAPAEGKQVKWLDYIARAGYTAKGVVYGLVGVIAAKAAFESGNSAPGKQDVFQGLLNAPFGRLLLGLAAIGMLCYVGWRAIQVIMDPGRKGTDWKGIATRCAFAVSGLAYLALSARMGLFALRGYTDEGGGDEEGSGPRYAGILFEWPGGWLLVVAVGLVFLGVAVHHFYRAWTAKFMAEYKNSEMSEGEQRFAKIVGRYGIAARGVTFTLIGLFVVTAGWETNAGKVKGLEGALESLNGRTLGWVALAVVAVGLISYGLYCFTRAKYRRFVEDH